MAIEDGMNVRSCGNRHGCSQTAKVTPIIEGVFETMAMVDGESLGLSAELLMVAKGQNTGEPRCKLPRTASTVKPRHRFRRI